jgi:hypothetical protein
MWRAKQSRLDLFLHANHFRTSTFIAHSDACCNRLTCDGATKFASVAGFGVRGPFGPRGGISSGPLPGSSSGRGDSPGSRIGGVISGCGLPGGISGGGSLGVPGVAGGISGGSIGIVHYRQFIARRRQRIRCDDVPRCVTIEQAYSGVRQTASILWPSGSSTNAP